MKIIVAGDDKTAELGPEIRRSADILRDGGRIPNKVSPIIGSLCLAKASSENEYHREFIRLLRYRDAFDARDFDISRRPGPAGWAMAAFKRVAWKLLRYQHIRIAFKQNLINRLFTQALESELTLRKRETFDLRQRIERLEKRLDNASLQGLKQKSGGFGSG